MSAKSSLFWPLLEEGHVLLRVHTSQLRPHDMQRKLNQAHVDALSELMRTGQAIFRQPLKGFTRYDWDTLTRLPKNAAAPPNMMVDIFHGGHRLVASKMHNSSGYWWVEISPTGEGPHICTDHYK